VVPSGQMQDSDVGLIPRAGSSEEPCRQRDVGMNEELAPVTVASEAGGILADVGRFGGAGVRPRAPDVPRGEDVVR